MALSYDELLQESQNIFAAPGSGMQITPGAQSLDDEWNRYRASIGMGNPAVQEQLAAGAQQDKPGLIGAFLRGAAAQGLGVVGNQAEAVASFTGNETVGKIADVLTGQTKQYSRPKEYSASEIFGSLGQFADYAADPYGMSYDIGGGFGSTAAMALEAAVLMKALAAAGVTGAASLGAGAIGAVARRLGLTSIERALATEGGRQLLSNLMLQVPLEAASEAGGTGGEMTHDQQTGERLQDVDRDAVRAAMAKNFAGNMAVLGASNLVEGVGLGRLFGGAAKGIKGKVKQGAEFLLTNAGQNAWEEGAQEGSNLYAQGKIDNVGQIVNPLQWNPEQVNAAAVGGIAGLGQGGVMSGAGYAMNKVLGKQDQEEQPQTTIGQSILNVANTHPEGEKWKSPEVEDDRVQCSAFVSDVYKNAGIKGLGHVNGDELVKQFGDAYHETSSGYEPKAGDLINWKDHVGIYDGNGGYIARNSTGGVHRGSMEEAQKYFGDVLGYGSVAEYTGSATSDNISQVQQQGETMNAEQMDEFDAETQRRISNIEDSFAEGTEQQERPSYVGEDGTVKDINEFTADELEDFMRRTDDKSDNSEIAKNYRSHIQKMINQKRNGGKLASAEEAFTSEEWNAITPEQQKKLKMFFSKRKNQKNKSGNPKYPGFNNASKDVQIKAIRDKRDRMLAEESKQAQQPQAQPQSAQQPAVAQGQNTAQPVAQQSQPVAQPVAQETETQQNQSDLSDIPWDNTTVNQQPAEPTKRISKLPENVKMQRTLRPVPQNLVNMLRRANSGDANAAKAFNKLPASMQSRIAAQLNVEREERQNGSAQLQWQNTPQADKNQNVNAEPGQVTEQKSQNGEGTEKQGVNTASEPGTKYKRTIARPAGRIIHDYKKRIAGLPKTRYDEESKKLANEAKRILNSAATIGKATKTEAEMSGKAIDAISADIQNGSDGELDARLQELINDEFSNDEQRELATTIFTVDKDHPVEFLSDWKTANRKELEEFVKPMFDAMKKNMSKGVQLYQDQNTGRYLRNTHNDYWYQQAYKEYGGTPSDKYIRQLALDTLLGENDWYWVGVADPKSEELQTEIAKNRARYEQIEHEWELLESVEPGIKRIDAKLKGKEDNKEAQAKPANMREEKPAPKKSPESEAKTQIQAPAQKEKKKGKPSERHFKAFTQDVDDAIKAMTFTPEKGSYLLNKYKNSLDVLVDRGEVTLEEAKENREKMSDYVKRGYILNDGRKLLKPEVRNWLDKHPFSYDKTKSREENIAAAKQLKEDFIHDTHISSTDKQGLTPEREALQGRILEYLYNVGIEKRKRERKATLAIGYPAAGKSTVTKDLTDNKGYLLIDADEAKKLLPEFHGGALADIVHNESSGISKALFNIALDEGDNICWPTIGGNLESLKKKISQLHNDGVKDENSGKIIKRIDESGKILPSYEVTLSLVDVPADEALKRIYNRFEETGRFDNPENISNLVLQKPEKNVTIQLPDGKRKERLGSTETIAVDNMILKNYLKIKDEMGVERYEWIDNGLSVAADYSEMLRESGELSRRPDGRLEPGAGQSGSGSSSGDNGRESNKTEEQEQIGRTGTATTAENQGGSSVSEDKYGFISNASVKDDLQDFLSEVGIKKAARKKPAEKVTPVPAVKLSKQAANVWQKFAGTLPTLGHVGDFNRAWPDILQTVKDAIKEGKITYKDSVAIFSNIAEKVGETVRATQEKNRQMIRGWMEASKRENGSYPVADARREDQLRDCDRAEKEALQRVSEVTEGAKNAARMMFSFGQGKQGKEDAKLIHNDAAKNLKKGTIDRLTAKAASDEFGAQALKDLQAELSKLGANPMFNPNLWSAACRYGLHCMARGARTLHEWAKTMAHDVGEKIKPWLGALWRTLQSYDSEEVLDPDVMTSAFKLVGAVQQKFPDITPDQLYKMLVEEAGSEKAVRQYKPFIKAAFEGMSELTNPTNITKEINDAIGEGEKENANTTGRTPENRNQGENGSGLSENAASKNAGRTDTETVGTGSEESEKVDKGRNGAAEEVRDTTGGNTGNDNSGLGANASENVRAPETGRQSSSNGGSTVSSVVTENDTVEGTVGNGQDQGSGRVPSREGNVVENDSSIPGNGLGRRGYEERRVGAVSEDGSYEILPSGDYHIIDPVKAEFGATEKEAFNRNVLALETIRRIREGDETVEFTPEVMNALANYNGFGRFRNQLFGGTYDNMKPQPGWEKEAQQLHDLMTQEEWESVQDSTTTSFYTPYGITTAMWKLAQKLGLKHGNILEPSMGVGGFFATMPKEIFENSTLTGIDIDKVATKISEQLYPSAHVFTEHYEDHLAKKDSFDFIVSNVPYDTTTMEDTPEARQFTNPASVRIHDFFFLRGINQLRPGGIMMGLTSTGTMDKQDTQIRIAMAKQAELVGAIRLPNKTFKRSAGTDAACDLLVFRKRETPISGMEAAKEPWIQAHLLKQEGNTSVVVNDYFVNNPDNIVGDMSVGTGQFGPTLKTEFKGTDEEIAQAVEQIVADNFPKDIMGETLTKAESEYVSADVSRPNYSFYMKDGDLKFKEESSEISVRGDKMAKSKLARPTSLKNILNIPAGQSPTGKNVSTTQNGYDDFIARHPEFKALDWRNSELDKKPDGKNYSWKEKLDDVERKNPELAKKAIDAAFKEKVEADRTRKSEELAKQIEPLIVLKEKFEDLLKSMRQGEATEKIEKLRTETLDMFNKVIEATPGHRLVWEEPDTKTGKTKIGFAKSLQKLQDFGDGLSFDRITKLDKGGGQPSDILTGVTLQSRKKAEKPSVQQSLQMQIADGATAIDIDKIAKENNKAKEEVVKDLIKANAVYETFEGDFVPANVYLSGNVRKKLREAQAIAKKDPKFKRNVEALKKVLPENLTSSEITVNMGASWIPVKSYKEFFMDLLGQKNDGVNNAVEVRNDNGRWVVEVDDDFFDNFSELKKRVCGSSRAKVGRFFNSVLNKRPYTIYDVDSYTKKKEVNTHETEAVASQMREMNNLLNEWLWDKDEDRRAEMEHRYNEEVNCTVNPVYDADFMTEFPGMSPMVDDKPLFPRKHQRNAFLKFLTEMRGIAAHDAGTGKTLLMAMLCMEMRRTGKAKKPIIFAHNANSAEIARNFGKYYPDSKVLYVKEFSKTANSETTRILMSQIVSGDWDAIVLPHSLIDRIAFTEEAALALRQEEIDYWTERALAEAQADDKIELLDEDFNADVLTSKYTANGENVMDKDEKKRLGSAAQYIRRIRTIRQKCRLMGQRLNQPGYINFEETGIDCCLVDEAHEFKKGPKNSNLQVKGLDTSVSEMGAAMDMLTKYINNTHDNKGVFEFTGTLITNTIPEIHTHMKYVMPDVLKEHGIYNLDDFLNSFTEVVHEQEPDAAGDIVYEDRLTKFINIPDLRNIAGQHIDIVTTQDLPEFTTRKTESGKDIKAKDLTPEERDYLENGYDHSKKPEGLPNHKVINVLVPNTKRMDYIYKQIQEFAKWMKKATGADAKEMFAKGMGLKFQNLVPGIGASIKNLYKNLTDLNMSKASMCVSNIKKLYDDSQKRGLPCAQVIFMEKGYNDERSVTITSGERVEGGKYRKNYSDTLSVEGYNMALDLKQKLVEQGFKPEQVAIVAGDENEFKDPEDRQRLADRVSSGEVAVVIAPYKTMGVGVNMQENLRAIHHIDAPWMPGELEQENKRAVRQGNHWNTVLEYRYTMPLLDGKKWSALAAKSSFIAAFMNTKSKVRTIESDALAEEENDSIGDIAETQAAAVGDTRFAKLADAKKKIEQLKKQRSNFEGRKRESKESAQRLRREIPQLKKNLACADIDDAVYAHDRELHPDFSIQIRNAATGEFQTFTDEKKATPFLEANYQAATRNEEYAKDFIRYRGFKVSVEKINLLKGSEYRLVARSEKPTEEAAQLIEEPKGKEEGKKKTAAKPKKEYIDLKTVKDEDYGQVEHVALQMTIGSLQNTLSNIRRSKEGWQKRLDKAEVDLVEAESASKGVWKDQERLDAYERKAKAIEKDMEENSIPAPDWYRNIATIGNVVLYNGEEWEIAGHRIPNGDTIKEYGLSLERYIAGEVENVVAPASEVTDTNGSLLFQPEDLQRDPRQRITDVSDDVNYTADFETTVDTAMSNILDDADPDFWNINSISRKVPGDTRKNGVPWKKTKTETDTETVTTFKAVNEKDEQIGETPQSVIVQRRQKLEASVAESTEPAIRQAVDDIVADVKTAFPGAKNFTREGQHITFTLPNGTAISVDIANQCFLNAEEAAAARKAHGKNANEPIRVNGYTETFDKGAAITLAQDGDRGTVFHESYHIAHNLVLSAKEKAAMMKYYAAKAAEQGRAVTEVMADAYRDWQLARRQHKGTVFGKLFQKIQDFARKVQAILTGTENVHNVMRKIAEGEVWTREAQEGVNAKEYLVTNNKITGDTKVPVIDITDNKRVNLKERKSVRQTVLDLMVGKDGKPIKITVSGEGPIGRIDSITDGEHIFRSNATDKRRLKALSSVRELLESAIYVEKHSDAKHGTKTKYIELYAVAGNKTSNTVTRFRIVAKEGNPGSGLFELSEVKFYDIIKEGVVNGPWSTGHDVTATMPSEISVAELLKDVKDRNDRPYVVDGQLNYEPAAIPALAAGKGKIEASISSAVNAGFGKAEAYANRNVRTANEATAEGRADKIFHNTQNKTKFQNALEWIEDRRKKFYSEWFDSLSSLKMVDEAVEKKLGRKLTFNEKVYERMRLVRALANGTAETLIKGNEYALNTLRDRIGQHIDPGDKQKQARAKYLKGLFNNVTMKDVLETIATAHMDKAHPDYLKRHGLNSWHQAFSNYLGARRILELLRIAKEKGITDYKLPKEINPADLQEVVKNAPKEFAAAAEKYYQLQKNLLILMEDGGLIRPSVHDKINKTYKEYCPLMIDYSDTASIDKVLRFLNTDGRSMANVQSMMKFVLEEGSERGLISPMEATYQGIETLTDRAERNKVAMKFVNMVANDKALQENGILQKVPGKADDPKNCVFTVLMNGEKVAFKTTQDLYGPIVGYGNESAGIVFGALRTSARMLRYGATTSPSFIVRNLIRDTIFAGISSRNGFIPVVDSVRGMLALTDRWGDKKLQGEFMAAGVTAFNYFGSERSAVESMKELTGDGKIHSLTDLIKAFFKGWENASEFVEASTRMGEFMRARKNGKSVIEAAFDARDVTLDFSRSGTSGRTVNQVVPFFNACLQGGDKLRNLFIENPVGTMAKLAKYIILPSLLLWIFNHDEPWYKEIDPHIRMQNWIIGSVRIPKPQEAGVIFGSGTEALLDIAAKNDPEAIGNWVKAFKDNLLPNILPTMFLPILEWQANYSFFREKPIEGNRLQRLPAGMRYNKGTSELSKAIGANTGLSPVKLDNVWRDYTGTMGMIAIQSLDPVIGTERNQPAKQLKERVFIRDFFLNDMNMNRTSEDFYNLVIAAQQHHAGYGVKGKPTPAVAAINKALRDVSLKNKEIQQITDAKNISPENKRKMIDQKRKVIHQIQKKTLQRFRDKF